jgi:quercetin dioxygenase-like cupin family protein
MKLTQLLVVTAAWLPLCTWACARQPGPATSDTPRATPNASTLSLTISRSDSRSTQQGAAEQFTGAVRVEPLFAATAQSQAAGASVSFEPGARSAWHSHPRGQVLIVTAGTGRVQQRGGPVEDIRAGDVVWTPPGVEHWHGAAPSTAMTHIAIQEHRDGKVVEWGRKVPDAEYQGR